MKNIKVIIGIHIVFLALIIATFLPALKSGDEGYNAKTVAEVPAQQVDVTTEAMTSENVAIKEVVEPTAFDMTAIAVTEQQPPSVIIMEDVVVAEKLVTNESVSTAEYAIAAQEMEATEQQQPIITPTKA
ncbi:MAG: hypothetical protein ACI9FO_001266 [Methylophagaceae bacterium]|jgi:hypothetical protein